MGAPDLSFAFGLPPEAAIAHFEAKGYAMGFRWQDVWAESHAKAFTVAGVLKQDVLEDIRGAVTDAIKGGETFTDFKKKLQPVLERKGWLGKGLIVDEATGDVAGKRLSPRRLETIFRTNTQSAYMAGKYRQFLDNAGQRPYWQYVAVLDNRTRPRHKSMNGRVFRYDDPFWQTFFPPNGWNCRCSVRARGSRDIERESIPLSESGPALVDVEQTIGMGDQARLVPTKGFKLPSGETFTADPGFGFNGGQVQLAELGKHLLDRSVTAAPRLAAMAVDQALAQPRTLSALVQDFGAWARQDKLPRGEIRHVGAIKPQAMDRLELHDMLPESGVISIRDEDLLHARRHTKAQALPDEFWETLPNKIAAPDAVLLDMTHDKPSLLYAYRMPEGEGKLVIVMDYEVRGRSLQAGKTGRIKTNLVRTGKIMSSGQALKDATAYKLLWGEL
ncbi:phage minor head protein [Chitinimonas viridis]|uniref:Phage minor head protein n=1 Tax=Chitinimonas viridis TaxID=664880 RepID=A0ABT8B991_9NEIS|nr:phage minor head protein [Chitinimonas viridis]MDN3578703.1 phage minor head protein [Chitinimonas viridis]